MRREEQVLHDLLGDGRAPLPRAVRPQVDERRPGDSPVIEALVLVEPRILGRQDGQLHVRGNRCDGNDRPTLGKHLGEDRAVAREHSRYLRRLVVLQLRDAGQPCFVVPDREKQPDSERRARYPCHGGQAFRPCPRTRVLHSRLSMYSRPCVGASLGSALTVLVVRRVRLRGQAVIQSGRDVCADPRGACDGAVHLRAHLGCWCPAPLRGAGGGASRKGAGAAGSLRDQG